MTIGKYILNEENKEIRERQIKALNELSDAIDKMIIGEYVDTEFEGKEISYEYLEYMHKNKTGALIKASIRIGRNTCRCKQRRLR